MPHIKLNSQRKWHSVKDIKCQNLKMSNKSFSSISLDGFFTSSETDTSEEEKPKL